MPLNRLLSFLSSEHRRNPWMLPGVALTASAALGSMLPALIELIGLAARLAR